MPGSALFVARTCVQSLRRDTSRVTANDLIETPALERDVAGRRRLAPQERRVEIVAAALFVVVAGVMLTAAGDWDEPLSAVLLTATYAVVDRVSFLLGPGQVSPTQLVFVPMLFLLPPEAVPALVAAGSLLGALPEIVVGRTHPERALFAFAGSWYAVGPALVFALFDPGAPSWDDAGVYALALGAQFGTDFVASTLRERLGSGIPPRELMPVLGVVYLVDVLLSPIGFMAVLASEGYAYAYLLAVPPGGLLALIAHERRRRIEHELSLGRAYRRSTRMLDDQAEELRRARLRVGEAMASTLDRAGLEHVLLNTAVEAVEADAVRLSERAGDGTLVERLAIGDPQQFRQVLSAAETELSVVPAQNGDGEATALAIPLVSQILGDGRHCGAGRRPRRATVLAGRAGPARAPRRPCAGVARQPAAAGARAGGGRGGARAVDPGARRARAAADRAAGRRARRRARPAADRRVAPADPRRPGAGGGDRRHRRAGDRPGGGGPAGRDGRRPAACWARA